MVQRLIFAPPGVGVAPGKVGPEFVKDESVFDFEAEGFSGSPQPAENNPEIETTQIHNFNPSISISHLSRHAALEPPAKALVLKMYL